MRNTIYYIVILLFIIIVNSNCSSTKLLTESDNDLCACINKPAKLFFDKYATKDKVIITTKYPGFPDGFILNTNNYLSYEVKCQTTNQDIKEYFEEKERYDKNKDSIYKDIALLEQFEVVKITKKKRNKIIKECSVNQK